MSSILTTCFAASLPRYRCEPVALPPSVHAQAIDGLIHWGLIREVNRSTCCQLLILSGSLQLPFGVMFAGGDGSAALAGGLTKLATRA